MTFRDNLGSIKGCCPRVAGRVLGVGCAVALAMSPLAGLASASAATSGKPLTETSLFGGLATFKADGHTWRLNVAAEAPLIAGQQYTTVFGLSTTGENDGWVFNGTPKADVSANASTGAFSLDSHSAFAPVASANVKFKATSHKAASCSKGSETLFTGTMTGSISLVANGKLAFSSSHAKFGPGRVIVDRGCIVKGNPCGAGVWGAFGKGGSSGGQVIASGDDPGLPGQHSFEVSLGDVIPLPKPADAAEDIIVTQKPKSESYNSAHHKLTVDAGSGRITGSIVVTGTHHLKPVSSKCTLKGATYKETSTFYDGVNFTSPVGHTLHAKSFVVGSLTMPASGFGELDLATFKKA